MNWLTDWLPDWQFSETHHRDTAAPPARLLDVAERWRPDHDRLIGLALQLREAPARLAGALGLASGLATRPRFGRDDFLALGRLGDEALALGLAGRFWQPAYGLQRLPDAQAWRQFQAPGQAKLLLAFQVQPAPAAQAARGLAWRLITVTRVHCPDAAARRALAPYWALIRPVSGLIRHRMLADICRQAEATPLQPGLA